MKTYIYILIMLILACSSNKQLLSDASNCNFDDKISEKDKNLNLDITFKRIVDENGAVTLIQNDTLELSVSRGYGEYDMRYKDKIKHIVKLINYNTQTLKATNSYSFYSLGNFNIGNEYIYDKQGQVIKTIDHNQYNKYPICYKEIIKSTIKKAGRKFYFQGLERDSLINHNKIEYSWKVYFATQRVKKFEIIKHKFFRIDAKTGKTITEEIVN
jgi:hypothetical protein